VRKAVPLWKGADRPNPCDYWDLEVSDEHGRLCIKPDVFYILPSKEKLRVPKGVCIYCRASDETMGEMRIHYAVSYILISASTGKTKKLGLR